MSSQEDYYWETFLNEAGVEEDEIEKLQSVDSNLQSSVQPKEFNTNTQDEKDEEDMLEDNLDQGELIRWHLRLGNLSFHKLRVMAALGILPKRLLKAKIPKCSSCTCR